MQLSQPVLVFSVKLKYSCTIPLTQHLLVVRQWRKLLPRLEVPPSVIFYTQTNSMSLSWVTWMFLSSSSYYNDIKQSKEE
jgi:hypothetical protein